MKQIYYIFLFYILLPCFSRGEAVLPNGHFYMFISGGGGMSEHQPVKLDYSSFTLHFDVMAYDNVIVVPAEEEERTEVVPEDSVAAVNCRNFSPSAEPEKPIDPEPMIRCWFEYLRYTDEGGQVSSVTCQYGSSNAVFRRNPHPYTVYGKLTIYYNSVFPNEDTGNSSSTTSPAGHRRELYEMHIYYRQLPYIRLQGGVLPARLNFSTGDCCQIKGSTAKGGQGDYVYQWEQKTSVGWELIPWAGSQNLTYSNPVDGLLLRRKVTSGGETAYSNVCVLCEDVFGNRNYILHSRALSIDGDSQKNLYSEDITYYDDLGRPGQSVDIMASPAGGDIVTPIYYDNVGRSDSRIYLPYVLPNNRGAYDEDSVFRQSDFYSSLYAGEGDYAYNENVYEASSLNRVKEAWNAGKVFRENLKKTIYTYGLNQAHDVYLLSLNDEGTLSVEGYYVRGHLEKQTVENTDGYRTESFTDREGHTILERNYGREAVCLETYRVYDTSGRQVAVISPEGSCKLSVGKSYVWTDPVMSSYSYFYRYDGRDRLIEKKLPGAEKEYFVYDRGDRVVLWQDGNLREAGKWKFSVYDGLGRLKEERMLVNDNDRNGFQHLFDSERGFTLSSVGTLLHEYRYDTYESGDPSYVEVSFNDLLEGNISYSSFSDIIDKDNVFTGGLVSPEYIVRPCGLLTWEKEAILENDNTISGYLERAFYYDKRGRLLQTVSRYPDGGVHYVVNSYDFKGDVIRREECSRLWNMPSLTLVNTYSYDNRSRLQKIEVNLNNKATAEVCYEYDLLGRACKRIYGDSVCLETLCYNLQGWLTELLSPAFRMNLRYYDPQLSGSIASYTGNISEWSWNQGSNPVFAYSFAYDNYGRFKDARSFSKGIQTNQYTEYNLRYDRNGNIKLLMRCDGNGKNVADYTYRYAGNQLVGIAENLNQLVSSPDTGLVAASDRPDYVYDLNGNLKIDNRRGLNYQYNYLNLLSEASRSGVPQARYCYTAGGEKLGVADPSGRGYDYRGSFQYLRDGSSLTLEGVLFGEGRISAGSNGYKAYYYLKDHLGSIRAVIDSAGNVCERNDYYPFGLEHQRGDYPQLVENRLKYNGKEKQYVGDLNFLDYGARLYDKDLARWFVLDAMQENYPSWSPYTYCLNNPLKFVDPTGQYTSPYYDKYGNYLGVDHEGFTGEIRITTAKDFETMKSGKFTKPVGSGIGKNTLSARAYSRIYTHILAMKNYDISRLEGGAIAVKNGDDEYNSPSRKVGYAMTNFTKNKNLKGPDPFRISVNQGDNGVQRDFTLVEQVENILGAHEYIGHGVRKYGDHNKTHYMAYDLQVDHPSWQKCTPVFRGDIMRRYKRTLTEENPDYYYRVYDKFLKYWYK
ncbi:DUF6443 domain-containing protein [Odoribacter laneus]|uniref:DUF6443 domain-containing protein n=1 Tax=Odoribacter laneus TaxID=626933 RepID=UPI003AB22D07